MRSEFARRIARNSHCCCSRNRTWAACSDAAGGSWFMSRISRKPLPPRRGRIFRTSSHEAASGRPTTTSPSRSSMCGPVGPMTSPTAAPPSPVSTNIRTLTNGRLPPAPATTAVQRYAMASSPAGPFGRAISRAPVSGRAFCCCHWVRWPRTISGPPSRRTCWPPAVSKQSTREASAQTVWAQPCAKREPLSR